MKSPHIADKHTLNRRTFLRGAGVAISLPILDSMTPVFARAKESNHPKRMLAICNNLGLLPDRFFPTEVGTNFTLSPYLNELKDHRKDFTVLSGVSHLSLIHI